MKALFDTNILIDYLKGVDAAKVEVERHGERLVSIVTWMELLAGAHPEEEEEEEEDVIEMFLRDFRLVEITQAVARAAVELRRTTRVRLPDAIVWATAQAESALLVTRNTKDFPEDDPGVRVPY